MCVEVTGGVEAWSWQVERRERHTSQDERAHILINFCIRRLDSTGISLSGQCTSREGVGGESQGEGRYRAKRRVGCRQLLNSRV